jgi:hypothetical protein
MDYLKKKVETFTDDEFPIAAKTKKAPQLRGFYERGDYFFFFVAFFFAGAFFVAILIHLRSLLSLRLLLTSYG